jgi:hypothetical protein
MAAAGRLFPFKEGTAKKITSYCHKRRHEHQQRQQIFTEIGEPYISLKDNTKDDPLIDLDD